jgi:hypothetical protein
MLKLTRYNDDDRSDSLPFPSEAARLLRSRLVDAVRAPIDRGSSEAARRVEAAMKEVELRFDRLKDLMGFSDPDPDRPRAA